MKFESHGQLVIPIDNPDEGAIAAWIDDKLIEFTRAYFEINPVMKFDFQGRLPREGRSIRDERITSTRKSR
jgi:hypothetical protein